MPYPAIALDLFLLLLSLDLTCALPYALLMPLCLLFPIPAIIEQGKLSVDVRNMKVQLTIFDTPYCYIPR